MSNKNNYNDSDYMLLGRLVEDCKYFLGNGTGSEKHLWAGSVDSQIDKMLELHNGFSNEGKPEWLSLEQIENYRVEMLNYTQPV